jgi:protein TonB
VKPEVQEVQEEKNSDVPAGEVRSQVPDARAEAENKREIDEFLSQILYRIEKAKHYPLVARRRRMEGVVKCKFTISRDGMLKHVEVIKKNRFSALDRAAVAAVKKGAPYPAFPKFLKDSTFTSTVDIRFELMN